MWRLPSQIAQNLRQNLTLSTHSLMTIKELCIAYCSEPSLQESLGTPQRPSMHWFTEYPKAYNEYPKGGQLWGKIPTVDDRASRIGNWENHINHWNSLIRRVSPDSTLQLAHKKLRIFIIYAGLDPQLPSQRAALLALVPFMSLFHATGTPLMGPKEYHWWAKFGNIWIHKDYGSFKLDSNIHIESGSILSNVVAHLDMGLVWLKW